MKGWNLVIFTVAAFPVGLILARLALLFVLLSNQEDKKFGGKSVGGLICQAIFLLCKVDFYEELSFTYKIESDGTPLEDT